MCGVVWCDGCVVWCGVMGVWCGVMDNGVWCVMRVVWVMDNGVVCDESSVGDGVVCDGSGVMDRCVDVWCDAYVVCMMDVCGMMCGDGFV
jgi:hypothetical protein